MITSRDFDQVPLNSQGAPSAAHPTAAMPTPRAIDDVAANIGEGTASNGATVDSTPATATNPSGWTYPIPHSGTAASPLPGATPTTHPALQR